MRQCAHRVWSAHASAFMRTPKVELQADKPHLHLYAPTEPLGLSHVWLPRLPNGRVTSCTQSEGSTSCKSSRPLAPPRRNVSHRCSHRRCRRRSMMQRCNFLSSGGTAILRLWMNRHFVTLACLLNLYCKETSSKRIQKRCGTTHGDAERRLHASALAQMLGEGGANAGAGVCRSMGH
jgi:hypothetical protein